ncbi:MAG: AAA family ATPase [Burkholderiales bacterium]
MIDLGNSYENQQKLIASLRDSILYPESSASAQLIETHISWVLLAGPYAYKIKKALNLGFLDYSTLDARRFYCDEEIRLNRRTAPDIYLDTVAIGGSPDNPRLGAQPAIEYAVRMRHFAAEQLMDSQLVHGRVAPLHIDNLAGNIAGFHASIPAAQADSGFGTAATIRAAAMENFSQLRLWLTDDANRARIDALQSATEATVESCKKYFGARLAQGFVRECHGDLHLGNIVLDGDVPVLFDCIEFNPALRWIDVMNEIAFAVMDLLHRDHAEFAWRFLNAYLEASGDYGGVSVLRFYLGYRAAVRAKVCAIRSGQTGISAQVKSSELTECGNYLALARQCLERHRPVLIITHGLPGSGKTLFSQLALQRLGAIRIRSDVERKRIFGVDKLESSCRLAMDIYSPNATKKTYARLLELAGEILRAGFPVIVDAAFLRLDERESFHQLAKNMSLPFAIASLHADDVTLRERLRLRRNDASEADVAVLEKLKSVQQLLLATEFAYSVSFTTEETPDSAANSQAWGRFEEMLKAL